MTEQHSRIEASNRDAQGLIFRLQATTTLDEYNKALAVVEKQFPGVRIRSVNGQRQTQSAAEYLRALHPGCWTKFGNCALDPEEISAVEVQWKQARSYGAFCPLFAGRTTSAVEGQNNALLLGGVRDCRVMEALVLFCNLAVETLNDMKKKAKKWLAAKHTVTHRTKAMFDKQVWGAAACTVRKSTDSIYLVNDLVRSMDKLDQDEGEFHARSGEEEEQNNGVPSPST
ncbi:unnamed protein product [Phytophthora fragariaefolia]|uniref:Unnamed protein product n=1 Tax=Phytophthora fragariaefolia TaxID=1490495 RepID=A0A9W6XRK8_9STRA|nr:unnamed protein product [Phytophthora fragariaefolia]